MISYDMTISLKRSGGRLYIVDLLGSVALSAKGDGNVDSATGNDGDRDGVADSSSISEILGASWWDNRNVLNLINRFKFLKRTRILRLTSSPYVCVFNGDLLHQLRHHMIWKQFL